MPTTTLGRLARATQLTKGKGEFGFRMSSPPARVLPGLSVWGKVTREDLTHYYRSLPPWRAASPSLGCFIIPAQINTTKNGTIRSLWPVGGMGPGCARDFFKVTWLSCEQQVPRLLWSYPHPAESGDPKEDAWERCKFSLHSPWDPLGLCGGN